MSLPSDSSLVPRVSLWLSSTAGNRKIDCEHSACSLMTSAWAFRNPILLWSLTTIANNIAKHYNDAAEKTKRPGRIHGIEGDIRRKVCAPKLAKSYIGHG